MSKVIESYRQFFLERTWESLDAVLEAKGKNVEKMGKKAKDDEWFDFKDKKGKVRRMPRAMAAGLFHYGIGMQGEDK